MAQISSKNKECVLNLKTWKTNWGCSVHTTPKCFPLFEGIFSAPLQSLLTPIYSDTVFLHEGAKWWVPLGESEDLLFRMLHIK